jgi:hypothetical protein
MVLVMLKLRKLIRIKTEIVSERSLLRFFQMAKNIVQVEA